MRPLELKRYDGTRTKVYLFTSKSGGADSLVKQCVVDCYQERHLQVSAFLCNALDHLLLLKADLLWVERYFLMLFRPV